MRFPYRALTEEIVGLSTPNMLRPLLRLQLTKGSRRVSVMALLDTGADVCFFQSFVAHHLGISPVGKRISTFSGTIEKPQYAFHDTVLATIWNGDLACPALKFEMEAGFSAGIDHLGFGLLGQKGFFSNFPVTFNLPAGYFDIG